MPFNSIEYFIFLWVAVLVFYTTPESYKKISLLAISAVFYISWSPYFALFLLSAITAAYALAFTIDRSTGLARKRWYLTGTLLFFLGAFVFFKGLPLWRQSFNFMTHVAMPIGFSYYTFRLLSYVIDVYWEKIKPEKDFIGFASFVAFFPHILSGPIQRADEFFPQVRSVKNHRAEFWTSGLRLILYGLFKKLVIADNLAIVVDNVFGHVSMYNATALWMASYVFYLQLYADFSGLTDIAIGSGRLFGIDAPQNFNRPYLAKNIQEFWRRWHMTLCRWINDYLFLPLRMSLRNWENIGLVLSLFINMLAISLWHGFSSGFIAFGLVQGTLISVSVLTLRARDHFFKGRKTLSALRRIVAPVLTFHLIVFSFIFFRYPTVASGFQYISKLFQGPFKFNELGMGLGGKAILGCGVGLLMMDFLEQVQLNGRWNRLADRLPTTVRWSVYYLTIAGFLIYGRFWPKEFIYFKF
ncbi:MAG: hypothetical protein AUJ72_01375 [Candidatus Omnitrophica bacterium CG1_02_46_14]|nr:MAG: hypothetical protein AUJ72_01375 [Candidatus Omnitrophica bacterium CG1_02_46_14]